MRSTYFPGTLPKVVQYASQGSSKSFHLNLSAALLCHCISVARRKTGHLPRKLEAEPAEGARPGRLPVGQKVIAFLSQPKRRCSILQRQRIFRLVLQLQSRRALAALVGPRRRLLPYRSSLLQASASVCFNMSQSEVFNAMKDAYGGIRIDPDDLPADPSEFCNAFDRVASGKPRL